MMKKLLFLGLAFSASVGVSSAQKARFTEANLGPKVPAAQLRKGDAYYSESTSAVKGPTSNQKINARGTIGTKIGKSFYDLPSTAAVANRIIRHTDGSVSAV